MKDKETYFYIDVFPAGYGDCFMVRCADKGNKTNILIDGGLSETYLEKGLQKYLEDMHNIGEVIDLLVVTHIDNDHINGIIKLITDKGHSSRRDKIQIKEIWFNTLSHITNPDRKTLKSHLDKEEIISRLRKEINFKDQDYGIQEIGGREGSVLSALFRIHEYKLNERFNEKAVALENEPTDILINGQIRIKLLSPNLNKLEDLRQVWIEKLKELSMPTDLNDFDDEFEMLMRMKEKPEKFFSSFQDISSDAFNIEELSKINGADTSAANGSSIAFTLSFSDIHTLFLGDAHTDLIESELSKLEEVHRKFKLMKVSHHGSNGNIGSLESKSGLLNLIEAENYLISTNGKRYAHPDKETIAKILMKDKTTHKTIIYNYPNSVLNSINLKSMKENYKTANLVKDGDSYFKINLFEGKDFSYE
jgi:beta-lactamase superfamily II metal-dependent hydrolase